MERVSRNASLPYLPYSRPKPEYLNPPQGACGSSFMPLITTRALEVGPDDGGKTTIFRVVGDPDCLILGVISDDTQNGTKNLFLGDRHVVFHVDENGGLHEVARFETFRMTFSADQHLSPFFDAFANVGFHTLTLFLRHHWSNRDVGIGRIADGEGTHLIPYGPLHLVEPALGHEKSDSARKPTDSTRSWIA